MCEILRKDNEMIEKARKENNLPKPSDFKDGRINPSDIERLLALVVLPFAEDAVDKGDKSGFKSIGVNYNIQLNRIQQVFGISHVKVSHEVVEKKEVEKEDKNNMIYYKTYVTVMIGNYTTYTNSDNKPDANFVHYYDTTGIGWAGAINEGTAEKNSRANGIKEALKNMGMLRDLYLDNEDDDNSGSSYSNSSTMVVLQEDPTLFDSGMLFMKSKAKDLAEDKEIDLVIYRNNKYNEEEHNQMIEMLNQNSQHLVEGKKLKIEYKEKMYKDNMQYIVNKIKK
jgi:hypothetical protein